MRRIRPALAGETIEVGDLKLDPVAHKVQRRGKALQLGPTEYRLLKFFMESPGCVQRRIITHRASAECDPLRKCGSGPPAQFTRCDPHRRHPAIAGV